MSKKFILFLLIPIIVISAILIFIINSHQSEKIEADNEAITKDKLYWEYIRFRDPATGEIPQNISSKTNQFVNSLRKNVKNYDKFLTNDWQQRGPYEVGGRTRALAIDESDENIIIAGAVSGGLWRSTDAGATWIRTTKPEQLQSVTCVAQDTRQGKEHIWYTGTGELWGNSADLNGNGVYKSTDGGKSWFVLESTSTNTPNSWDGAFEYVWEIKTNPAADESIDEVVVSTALGGIYRSIDGGETWQVVLGGYGNMFGYFTDVEITQSGIYYATLSKYNGRPEGATVYGIYQSFNGTDWENITPENFPNNYKRIVIGYAPSNENIVYFLGETPGSGKWTTNSRGDDMWHSLWRLTNFSGEEGYKWDDLSENIPKPDLVRGHFNSQGSYNLCIAVKPNDPQTVFIGGVALYRSDTGWETPDFKWIGGTCYDDDCEYFYRYPNHHADNHTLTFLPSNPNILFTGSDGGVHKTVDNKADRVEWISLNNGYYTTQFYSIAIDHGENLSDMVLGGLQDNGTLLSLENNLMQEWNNPSRADGFCCAVPDGGKYVYSSQNSTYQPKIKIWRNTLNEDGTNKVQTRIDPIGGEDFIWNTPFILDPNDNNIMYLAGGGLVWRNSNLSDIPEVNSIDSTSINWDSLSYTRVNEQSAGSTRPQSVSAIGVSKIPANVLYYGTTYGKVFRLENANTGNPKPTEITGINMPGGNVSSIAVDPDNADEAIVAFSNYNVLSVFHTTDAGESWNPISGNLEENPDGTGVGPATLWIEIMKVQGRKFYLLGTSAGLFSTAHIEKMNTIWQQESPNKIGNAVIDMIDARNQDGFVAVGTHGIGTYTAKITSLPEKPQSINLVYPEDNATNVRSNQLFKWTLIESEPVTYKIQFSQSQSFDEIELEVSGIRGDSAIASGFEQGFRKYYWRVQSIGNGGPSEFSEIRSFTTAIGSPNLLIPENESTDNSIHPELIWENIENAYAYRLQVTTSNNFTIKPNVADTVIQENIFKLKNLKSFLKYNWRVASIDQFGEGEYSEPFVFNVDAANSVKNETSQIKLSIYPNPANDYINIKIDNLQSSQLYLEIFNLKGERVAVHNLSAESGGTLTKTISTRKFAQGEYIIKIISGKYSHSEVFLITR